MDLKALCGAVSALALLCACKGKEKVGESGAEQRASGSQPARTATIEGFKTPESVKWDSTQDVYFVSNINGAPNAKDGNGYISTNLIKGVPSPADIGYDAKRNRVLIPIFTGNRVEIWQLP